MILPFVRIWSETGVHKLAHLSNCYSKLRVFASGYVNKVGRLRNILLPFNPSLGPLSKFSNLSLVQVEKLLYCIFPREAFEKATIHGTVYKILSMIDSLFRARQGDCDVIRGFLFWQLHVKALVLLDAHCCTRNMADKRQVLAS